MQVKVKVKMESVTSVSVGVTTGVFCAAHKQQCKVGCQIMITEHLGRRDFQFIRSIGAKGVGNVERKESEQNEGQKRGGK